MSDMLDIQPNIENKPIDLRQSVVKYLKCEYDADTKTWSGMRTTPMYNPKVSAASVLLHGLELRPDHIGQINHTNGVQKTNHQIRTDAVRIAKHMQIKFGVRKDDVIGIIARNHDHVSSLVLGALSLAAPINALDPIFRADEIAHMFGITEPRFIFADLESLPELREALKILNNPFVQIIMVDQRVDGMPFIDEFLVPTEDEQYFVPTDVIDGTTQTAFIVCTSGTTGLSKGVRVSHAQLLHNTLQVYKMNANDVVFCFSTLFWVTGISLLAISVHYGVTRIITTQPFESELLLDIIETHRVTKLLSAPTYLVDMLHSKTLHRRQLSNLKYLCGGSAIPIDFCKQFNKYLSYNVSSTYGQSECDFISIDELGERLGSVGILLDGVSARIVSEDAQLCEPMIDGEVLIKKALPILGYWKDVKATTEVLDSNGWLHTGDIGHFDEDGYLYLTDRKKAILKYRNVQISPNELENLILTCPGVAKVAVVGVPDPRVTDLPTAVVVRIPDYTPAITEQQIKDVIKDKLTDFKQLRGGVYFVNALPLTASGKIQRQKVKDIAIDLFNNRPN